MGRPLLIILKKIILTTDSIGSTMPDNIFNWISATFKLLFKWTEAKLTKKNNNFEAEINAIER